MTSGFRRAIRITSDPRAAIAEIEDDFHHFVVTVEHDGAQVTGASSRAIRYPWTTCPMASGALGALLGLPIASDPTAAYRYADPLAQCTHMLEMAGLAVTHAARGLGERRYDVIVTDPERGAQAAELACDGHLKLRWRLQGGVIAEPGPYAGRRPGDFRSRTLAGEPADRAEAILILRRAVALAASRKLDVDAFPAAADMGRPGVCFTFQPERAVGALRRRGSIRDFSDGPGPLASPISR